LSPTGEPLQKCPPNLKLQWKTASEKLPVENCQWKTASGKLPVENCQWITASRKHIKDCVKVQRNLEIDMLLAGDI